MRVASGSDLDSVAVVWRESALSMDGLPRDVPSVETLRRRIDLELDAGWDLRIAIVGEHVAGFLATREAVLDQIFVVPREQGKGIGSALINAAKEAMPTGFTLRMDARNELARRFYVGHGLRLIREGTHPASGIPVHFYGWNMG